MEDDREVVLRSICAWCNKVLVEGDQLTPVTNGICPSCMKDVLEEAGIVEEGEDDGKQQ